MGVSSGPVVVTGVAGFIGSHLAEALLSSGTPVVGVDRRCPVADRDAAANLAGCLVDPRFTTVVADLAEADLDEIVRAAPVVFHLAGVPGMRPSWGSEFAGYTRDNILGTQRLALACMRMRVPRLVVASSSSVYGDRVSGALREDAAAEPASPYGVTKLAAEQLCLAYARHPRSTTSVVALRYFTVFGPRQRPDMLIGRALRAASGGEPLPLYGDGAQRRDFTYVADVVAATVAAASARVRAETVNVGAGATTSVAEVLRIAARLTGGQVRLTQRPPHEGDVVETHADNAKALRLLGWRPTLDVAEGMARQLAWMRENEPVTETMGSR